MTREEIVEGLKLLEDNMVYFDELQNDKGEWIDVHELLFEAIQALSQEPTEKPMTVDEMEREYEKSKALFHKIVECDDAISRKKAIYVISACDGKSAQIEALEQLPPVTQKSETVTEFADRCRECGARYGKLLEQKSGKWIYDETIENWRCSKCNETPKTMGYVGTADFMAEHFKFCNHCGARMESEE